MLLEAGFHLDILCAALLEFARPSAAVTRHQGEPVPVAVGVVSDLLRVGNRQARKRRRALANLTAMDDYYQNGPLPAWPGCVRAAASRIGSTR